jgi:hypothetical protein
MIKRKPLLALAILSFVFALICIAACVTYAGNLEAGASGGATGFGIIASTFILCGSFFLYRHLTNKNI